MEGTLGNIGSGISSRIGVVRAAGTVIFVLAAAAVAVAITAGWLDLAASRVVPPTVWEPFRQATAAIAVLAAIATALAWRYREPYLAALWLTAPRLTGIVAAAWIVAYLAPIGTDIPPAAPLAIGIWAALVLWLLITVPFRRAALIETGQTRTYRELISRYHQVIARYDDLMGQQPTAGSLPSTDTETDKAKRAGLAEAGQQLNIARRLLCLDSTDLANEGGLEWATATGYISVWETLHRADEALIDAESQSAVIGDAWHDMLRLFGANIRSADKLQDALRAAVRYFDANADRLYFYPQSRRQEDPTPGAGPAPTSQPALTSAPDPKTDAEARAVIREVRHAVNDYRDDRMSGIVRARNRVLRSILVTGIAADVLLGLAILLKVPPAALATAGGLFLVGGLVGLFNRLRLEGDSWNGTTPDYGLFDARLLHTLLVSGLAGVGGVFLMSAAPLAASILATTTTPSEVAGTTTAAISALPLEKVFDLGTNRLAVLVAAVFGLTPDLVIGRLRQQTDALKKDLSTTEAAVAEGTSGSGAGH